MKKLYLRNFSTNLNGATVIRDEQGDSCYLLTGKWGLRFDALSLYTMSGELIAEAKQLTLGLTPKFTLYLNRRPVATISKSFGFIHELIYIRGLNWIVVGSILSNHFKVFNGSRLVFEIAPVKDTPTNCLTVNQPQDEPLAILIATILNHWANRQDPHPITKRWRQLNPLLPDETGNLSMGSGPEVTPLIKYSAKNKRAQGN